MPDSYFSDRQVQPKPRAVDAINEVAWGAIIALIRSRIADGSLGCSYPAECWDRKGVYGCDEEVLRLALQGEIHAIEWPLNPAKLPPTLAILDLLEFCYRAIGKPQQLEFHSFYNHHHLQFDVKVGRAQFREDVRRILSRNSLCYDMDDGGQIFYVASPVVGSLLKSSSFRTGDQELDLLLEQACVKYLDPDPQVRKEALEKLWDAWERLKSIEIHTDKKASVAGL